MKYCGLAVLASVSCWPRDAAAHLVSTRFGELYGGVLHPLTTLAHVVPWVGLGLLGGFQATSTARFAPWVLPLSAAVGSLLGSWLPELSFVTYLNLASFVALGILVALATELRASAFVALAVLVGLSHGYANGTPGLAGADQLLFVLGVAIAAHVLVTPVTALSQYARRRAEWGQIALRAAGSWIVAIGVIFVGFSLMPRP